ncbi:MAG: hypothetical protein K8R58_01760, partial [Bacteroidales bacterium]|nr:hypothetical protein [Bacteroidales bacterium]
MKKRTILFLFAALFLISSNLTAQHFQTVWSGNPYQPMTFIVNSATIDNINCAAGDEIAVFDVDSNSIEICVGVVVLVGEILPGSPAIITASTDDPLTSDQDGFINGHTIIYRIWDSSESEEITMVQAAYNTTPPFVSIFTSLGTAIVELGGSSSIKTTTESLIGCPGNFTVPIDVENMQNVTDFTLTLNYIPAELTYTNYQNVNAGLSGGTLTVTSSSGEVQMTWTSTTAVTIGTGTLLELIFNAPVVYTQTLSNLIWDTSGTNCQYLNGGTSLPAEFIDGIITIEPYPHAAGTITGSTSVCIGTTGEPYQIDPITNATSYVWELTPATAGTINGSGISITIDWSNTYNGQATLSVYGNNNCGNGTSSSLNIQVQPLPEADAGNDVQICENATYQLNGAATNYSSILWTTSGDGTFDDATLLNATYTPGTNDITNATVTLTLTAYPIAPCANNATDQMTITFATLPTSDAGVNDTICENSTCQLSGAATNESGVLWTTSGDGNFSNITILNPIYTPGTNDITNGSAILTLTAYATAPCTDDATDNMTLTIISLPVTNAGPDDDVCEDNPAYILSGTASNQSSILWTTAGDG